MNRYAKASFAQEVPEELIVYELADKSAKAFTPAAEALRDFRRSRREEADCWARDPAAWDEYQDIFDLRYLYDDEEIWEERAELIREEEEEYLDPYWWAERLDDDLEYYERLKREAANAGQMEERADFQYEDLIARDLQEIEEHQFWMDQDGDWRNVRYVNGLGFVTDEYDSGHDEPNEMNDPYPPVNDERFLNVCLKERRMKKCLDQLRRRAQRRAYEETRELCKRWRQLALMTMGSEPSCSFH